MAEVISSLDHQLHAMNDGRLFALQRPRLQLSVKLECARFHLVEELVFALGCTDALRFVVEFEQP